MEKSVKTVGKTLNCPEMIIPKSFVLIENCKKGSPIESLKLIFFLRGTVQSTHSSRKIAGTPLGSWENGAAILEVNNVNIILISDQNTMHCDTPNVEHIECESRTLINFQPQNFMRKWPHPIIKKLLIDRKFNEFSKTVKIVPKKCQFNCEKSSFHYLTHVSHRDCIECVSH